MGDSPEGTGSNEDGPPAYPASRADGVLRIERPETTWLSTGWNGGRSSGPAAYVVSVPEGWTCEDVAGYVDDRLERAGVSGEDRGPVLLTGVDLEHARGARCGPVTVYATAGISNPAALPMDPPGGDLPDGRLEDAGTVNLVVGTTRALAAGALANLLTVAAEAKAATLLADTGFSGTTTDAVVVGHDPTGPPAEFSGSATAVGAAARACVREALRASLRSRYEAGEATVPATVADATYGVSTDVRASVFRPDESRPDASE